MGDVHLLAFISWKFLNCVHEFKDEFALFYLDKTNLKEIICGEIELFNKITFNLQLQWVNTHILNTSDKFEAFRRNLEFKAIRHIPKKIISNVNEYFNNNKTETEHAL